MALDPDTVVPAARLLPQLRAVLDIIQRTPPSAAPPLDPFAILAGAPPPPLPPPDDPPKPVAVSTRYYPLCVAIELPHPGFDEAPEDIGYRRVDTFADGTSRTEDVDGAEVRRANNSLYANRWDVVDEDYVAECLGRLYAGRLGYCHEVRAWFVWDGTIWRRDATGVTMQLIRWVTNELSMGNAGALARCGAAGFLQRCEKMSRGGETLAIPAATFDADPMRLGTPGGTVDLATGALAPATPADRITRATAVAPAETSDCPRWKMFLDEAMGGDAALVGFLQRFCGYALTGATSEHALLYGLGEGGNGKSVFLNTLRGIFGDHAAVAAPDLLAPAKGQGQGRAAAAEIARLAPARLVTAAETEAAQLWAEGRIKLMTGGDAVTARIAGRGAVTVTPRFKLIVIGNHMPVLRDVDAAMRRRLCVVPFARQPAVPDRDLTAKLEAEWPAILRWMIEGCVAWRATGLGRPAQVVETTANYLAGQDVVGQFLQECCVTEPREFEAAGALYAAWCAYAKAAGEVPGSQKMFAAKLERNGMTRERTIHSRLYRGLRLLRPEERDQEREAAA